MTVNKLVIQKGEIDIKGETNDKNMSSGANLDLFYEIEVRDREGNLISTQFDRSRSLLKNFALMLRALMAGNIAGVISQSEWSVKVTLTATDGSTFQYPSLMYAGEARYAPSALEVAAIERTDTYGVVVGIGSASVSRDDFKLEQQISDGFEDGQMVYGKTTVEDVDGNPPDSVFRIIRTFTNESSDTITIREIGIIAKAQGKYVLIARDVLSTPQNVPVDATLTVRYIFKVTA